MILKGSLSVIWRDARRDGMAVGSPKISSKMISYPRFCWLFHFQLFNSMHSVLFIWALDIATHYKEQPCDLLYIHIFVFTATDTRYLFSKLSQVGSGGARLHLFSET